MISMYAEYSGRTLYVALSSDTIDGAKNGDTLYEMDTGKRYVYNETNDAWDEQPEEGGGGTLIEKTITLNGTFSASDDNADGYSSITTEVFPAEFDVIITNNLTGSPASSRSASVCNCRNSTANNPIYSNKTAPGNGKTTTCSVVGKLGLGNRLIISTKKAANFVLPTNCYVSISGTDSKVPTEYVYVITIPPSFEDNTVNITINPA